MKVFPDASTYPVVINLKKEFEGNEYSIKVGKFSEVNNEFIFKIANSKRLTLTEEKIWGFLLNDKILITEKIIQQSEPIETFCKINATSTANEAEEYGKIINEVDGYKLINTGTIDPYINFWGINPLVDKGKKFYRPYLPKNSNIISENRHHLYSSPKIILSKIALKPECYYDRNGEYASINTNCIHSIKKEIVPEFLIAILNSKLFAYQFECFFDGLKMEGGYLLFSSPNLRCTFLKLADQDIQENIRKLVITIEREKIRFLEFQIKFTQLLQAKISTIHINRKLENWYTLSGHEF